MLVVALVAAMPLMAETETAGEWAEGLGVLCAGA